MCKGGRITPYIKGVYTVIKNTRYSHKRIKTMTRLTVSNWLYCTTSVLQFPELAIRLNTQKGSTELSPWACWAIKEKKIVRSLSVNVVKICPIYDPYIGEVPFRGNTCHGRSELWGRVGSSFPCSLYFTSVSTGSPFAAGWTVSGLPNIGSRWVPNRGLRHSSQAL